MPDHDYYEAEVECRSGCPVKTDARGYLIATYKGDYLTGYKISRATNPFASICGKVCGAPCETACRRKEVDETLSIRNIKGFLTSKYGPECGDLFTPLTYSTARGSHNPKLTGKTVGIIGGGVAGFTCAHDLARLGHSVTIFEREYISGGMLVQGVPLNRLSREVIKSEIDSILQYKHIEVIHNCEVGKDISFNEIRNKFDAVFIAVGLSVGRILPMENANHPNVYSGLQFLLDFNFYRGWDLSNKKSVVIGGGDVAFDVARSALRCKSSNVELCCVEREHLGEMRGSKDERDGGRREGVIINDGWGPSKIEIVDGKMKGLWVQKVKRVMDENGRFNPEYYDEKRLLEGDCVFMAVGQTSNLNFLDQSGVEIDRGIIKTDKITRATNLVGVYAGGDVALGPKLFIDGIQTGSEAALAIDAYLTKTILMQPYRKLQYKEIEDYDRSNHYLLRPKIDRVELPVNVVTEPLKNTTVEYPEEVAINEGARCLECHIHPTFEGEICILCGGCVDVCPSYCLSMVSIDAITGGKDIELLLDLEFGKKIRKSEEGSVMLFDPLKCIRCGMCAIKCPTGSCKMSENDIIEDVYIERVEK